MVMTWVEKDFFLRGRKMVYTSLSSSLDWTLAFRSTRADHREAHHLPHRQVAMVGRLAPWLKACFHNGLTALRHSARIGTRYCMDGRSPLRVMPSSLVILGGGRSQGSSI